MRAHLLSALAALLLPGIAFALPAIGQTAPSFTVRDIENKTIKSESLLGSIVVLEWNNPVCPFVKKHYSSNNMQKLQAEATNKGVVWITINSGSAGKTGSLTPAQAHTYIQKANLSSTHYVLDAEGILGRLYGAKTTPHMFVIDKEGKLAYMGAIDSDTAASPANLASADNYVRYALADLAAGKPVKTPSTQSYGCGVKYAD